MRMKLVTSLVAGLVMSFAASSAQAVIISPDSVVANLPTGAGNIARTIDQSGLGTNFVSGVDDFGAYIAGNPLHATPNAGNAWSTPVSNLPGSIDFDLGQNYQINGGALWNSFQGFGIMNLAVYSSLDASFATAALLGNFVLADTNPVTAQLLAISGIGRYVRFDISSNNGAGSVNLSEVAFDVSAVPLPAPIFLLLAGLGVLGYYGRRGAVPA